MRVSGFRVLGFSHPIQVVQMHFFHELGVDPQESDGGRFYDLEEGEGEDGDVRRLRVRVGLKQGVGIQIWGLGFGV